MKNPWDDIALPSKDISARRIDHTHPLDLFWARDYAGNYLFIYEFAAIETPLPTALPDLSGIRGVFLKSADRSDKSQFVLLLKEHKRWEIFLCLCNDLVQTTRQTTDPAATIQALLQRLSHWQEFLKKIRPDILTEESIMGLIGELLFIRNHLAPAFGAAQAVRFWQGPEGLPQDFNVNSSAIEVKCQTGATASTIRISSAQQLCPQLPKMYLFVVTLGKTTPDNTEAINLPLLVGEITKTLESTDPSDIDRFKDLLHAIGYVDSDRYLDFSYVLTDQKMYHVKDGFPRICPDELRPGVDRVAYSIELHECEPFRECPDWMEC
ncbi:MAG: PD-(D/E)XK motif protein [Chloroflexi bacterium]|nr:PD-(D/E)XK motif protein [Chloroflexota bacterium]